MARGENKMPQFQAKLIYLGDQGMDFKNDQGQQISMLKVRFMEMGSIVIYDFSIMEENLKAKLAQIQPMSIVDGLFEMSARKDMKAFVRLLDVDPEQKKVPVHKN